MRENFIAANLLVAARPVAARGATPGAPPPGDWARLLAAADRHGVKALLARRPQTSPPPAPPAVCAELDAFLRANARRNLQLTGALWRILELFAAHGVTAIPFKGPTLAALAYGDLALRQFSDLDVLVAPEDLAAAGRLMLALGYEPEIDLAEVEKAAFREAYQALSFRRPSERLLVELHWELSPRLLPFALPFERVRERLISVAPGGKPMPTLGPEDLLLYLCAHGARHCWERLGWIADIAALVARLPQLDWDSLLRSAEALGQRRTLLLGLNLAAELLAAPLPPEVAARCRQDAAIRGLTAQVRGWLFQDAAQEVSAVARDIFYFKLQDGLGARLRLSWRLLTGPNAADYDFHRHANSPRFFALARPLRLLTQALRLT